VYETPPRFFRTSEWLLMVSIAKSRAGRNPMDSWLGSSGSIERNTPRYNVLLSVLPWDDTTTSRFAQTIRIANDFMINDRTTACYGLI